MSSANGNRLAPAALTRRSWTCPDSANVPAASRLTWLSGRYVNHKRIMRQMHGRAGFELLRHRILLST